MAISRISIEGAYYREGLCQGMRPKNARVPLLEGPETPIESCFLKGVFGPDEDHGQA